MSDSAAAAIDHQQAYRTPVGAALVTGGSRGIGRAICLALADAGFSVAVNYARRADAADQVVEAIRAAGRQAVAVQADIGQLDQHESLLDRVAEAIGGLSVLVNNAGITSPGRKDILEASPEGWDRVFATNLKGPFFLTQRAARQMVAARREHADLGRATIINISSISAFALSTNRADYCLTKAAMQMMTWLYAARLADDGIGVYEVCPGIVRTDMTAGVQEKYDALIAGGLTPIRRWGQPEDVAQAVVMLAEGRMSFSTGDRINVDGGFHIRQL